jgi:hypothetical protein
MIRLSKNPTEQVIFRNDESPSFTEKCLINGSIGIKEELNIDDLIKFNSSGNVMGELTFQDSCSFNDSVFLEKGVFISNSLTCQNDCSFSGQSMTCENDINVLTGESSISASSVNQNLYITNNLLVGNSLLATGNGDFDGTLDVNGTVEVLSDIECGGDIIPNNLALDQNIGSESNKFNNGFFSSTVKVDSDPTESNHIFNKGFLESFGFVEEFVENFHFSYSQVPVTSSSYQLIYTFPFTFPSIKKQFFCITVQSTIEGRAAKSILIRPNVFGTNLREKFGANSICTSFPLSDDLTEFSTFFAGIATPTGLTDEIKIYARIPNTGTDPKILDVKIDMFSIE